MYYLLDIGGKKDYFEMSKRFDKNHNIKENIIIKYIIIYD